jgi:hypothetical protein
MKICRVCEKKKKEKEFNKKRSECKNCQSRNWKQYYQKNKEQLLLKQKENPEQNRKKVKKFASKNREKINKKRRENYKNDENLQLKNKYRKETYMLFLKKNVKYSSLIGCSSNFFRKWIKSQLHSTMNIHNYGIIWELDHVIAVSSFNLKNKNQVKLCYHWENVRPCFCFHNKQKKNSFCIDQILIQELKTYNYKKSLTKDLLPPTKRNLNWGTRLIAVTNGKNANHRDNPQPSP